MFTNMLLGTLALAATIPSTLAAPVQAPPVVLTADSILAIDPTISSCANEPAPGECRTAEEAAPYISLSFTNFNIPSFGAQAALLSLILYETGGLKYDRNHFPGRRGQGTRNMQMPEYNLKYAQWLSTTCGNCGITVAEVEKAQAEGVDAVLELVNTDQWGFSSAAWFLDTQCDASIKEGLARADETGWEAYLTGCVQTTATEDRTAIWRKAVGLGHW